ncbi:hypothetical protein ACVWW4_000344 [Bradyrhizobium sp. LB7.1]
MASHKSGPNGVGANAVTDTARQLGATKPMQAGPHGALSSKKNTLFASYLAAARQLREPTIIGVPSLVRTMTSFRLRRVEEISKKEKRSDINRWPVCSGASAAAAPEIDSRCGVKGTVC